MYRELFEISCMYICLSNRSFSNALAVHGWTRVAASFCWKSRNRESRAMLVEGDPWEKQRVREVRRTPVSLSLFLCLASSSSSSSQSWQEMGGRGVRNGRDTPTTCVSQMWYENIEKKKIMISKKEVKYIYSRRRLQGHREI